MSDFNDEFQVEARKHMEDLDELCEQYAGKAPSEVVGDATATIITLMVMSRKLPFKESKQLMKDLNLLAKKMYQAGHVEGSKSIMPHIGRG